MTTGWVNFGDLVDPAGDHDQTALVDLRNAASPRTWTHRDLDRAADAVAHSMRRRGLRRGDRVAILAANRELPRAGTEKIDRAALVARAIALVERS